MTLVTFGNFPAGGYSEFKDRSCGGVTPYLTTSVVPNTTIRASGDYLGRYKTAAGNANTACYQDPATAKFVRVHLLGFPTTTVAPAATPGSIVWWAWSTRKVTGSAWVVMQEWHQPNGLVSCPKLQSIPAPFNFQTRWAGGKCYWTFIVRGSYDCTNGSFTSYAWGNPLTFTDPGANRVYRSWDGGLSPEVIDGQLWHFLAGWRFATDNTGWFEGWAAKHGDKMINVVPRTNCPTTYPFTNYPIVSQYYSTSEGGDVQYDHMFGAIADDQAALKTWQTNRLAYSLWDGVIPIDPPPPPPPLPPPSASVTSASSIKTGDVLSGTVAWTVTSDPAAATARFFFDGIQKADIQGTTSFKHTFNADLMTEGAHTCGWWILDVAGTPLFRSPSVSVTVKTTTVDPAADKGHKAAWDTKVKLQAEITKLKSAGYADEEITRKLGSARIYPRGTTSLAWQTWLTVRTVTEPVA